jgi:hypothetical protein
VSLSPKAKRPGSETDHLLPSTAETKNARSYTSTPMRVVMAGCLTKHSNNYGIYIQIKQPRYLLYNKNRQMGLLMTFKWSSRSCMISVHHLDISSVK